MPHLQEPQKAEAGRQQHPCCVQMTRKLGQLEQGEKEEMKSAR